MVRIHVEQALRGSCHNNVRFAIDNREYYYALSVARQSRSIVRSAPAYRLLGDAVRRCIDNRALSSADPEAVTDALWGLVHGMVSLELAGHFPNKRIAQERFIFAGKIMLAGLRVG